MKILQVVSFFSPMRGGGIVAVAYQLSRALAQRGHEVTIYTSDFALDRGYIDSLGGVKVRTFHSYLSLCGRPLFMPGIVGAARKELMDFDIVHMHGYRGFHYLVLRHYARKYGIPYIVDAHGATARNSYGMFRHIVDMCFGRWILKDATKVIAETEQGTREYVDAGISQDRIAILYPNFPVEDFGSLPPAQCFKERYNVGDKSVIMFMGRIAGVKGIDFLLSSFRELTRQRDAVVLTIVGADDGYRANLQKMIGELNLSDKVIFTGYLDGEEKLAALQDASMLVLPSVYEQGLPKPCIEATLCGTPFVITKDTGAAVIASQMGAGYQVEYGNRDELKDMMQYILGNRDEAAINVEKAKKYIMANLSLEKGIEDYENLYYTCVNHT